MNATPKSCGNSTGRAGVAPRLLAGASLAIAIVAVAAALEAQSSYGPEEPTPTPARAPAPPGIPPASGDSGFHLGIAVTSTPRGTSGESQSPAASQRDPEPQPEFVHRGPDDTEPGEPPDWRQRPAGQPQAPEMNNQRPVAPSDWYAPPAGGNPRGPDVVHGRPLAPPVWNASPASGNPPPPNVVNRGPFSPPAWYPPPMGVNVPPPGAIQPGPGVPPAWYGAVPYSARMQAMPAPVPQVAWVQPPGSEVPSGNVPSAPAPPGLQEGQRIGRAPEESNASLLFLRDESVLLKPCERQIEVTLQYLIDESDIAAARLENNVLEIGELRQRQRLLLLPLEFRMGLTPVTQGFVRVPFGWSNAELAFGGDDEFSNSGGLGDVSAGLTREFWRGGDGFPTILGSLVFSAPTGNSSLASSLTVPQAALGEGFWTLSIGGTVIQTFDPVVIFYGAGYRHRFDANIDGFAVKPGQQAFYRFGVGFAVSPRVTFSASFAGSFIGRDTVDGVPVGGTIREPVSLRLATTIIRDEHQRPYGSIRTVEPFVIFGMTDESVDTAFGVSWTW